MGCEVLYEAAEPIQHEFNELHRRLAINKRLRHFHFPVVRLIFDAG